MGLLTKRDERVATLLDRARSSAVSTVLLLGALATTSAGCATVPTPRRPSCAKVPERLARATRPVDFIEDDLARARAEARASGKLLFIDGWAPWCHTCLSMRREVLSKPALGVHAGEYVFAAFDTDREENAEVTARFPMKAWPTFFVVDPVDLRILALHAGSMSLSEMDTFLAEGTLARAPSGADAPRARALGEAHAAFAAKDFDRAVDLYEHASLVAWPRRNEALLGAMRALGAAKRDDRCRAFGLAHLNDVTGTSPPADFVYYLRECGARASSPEKEKILDVTLSRLRALAAHPAADASVDDRQDLLDMLAEAEADAGHPDLADQARHLRIAILERAASAATSPEEARVFDYARMGAYLAVGRGDDAIAMLEERTRQLPSSYEAWARLASTRHTLHREPEALAAVTRAIELSYGPRRLRYLALRADVELALGDRDAQIATLEAEVSANERLPVGQADAERLADAKKRLAAAVAARDATRLDTSRTTPSR